MEIIIGKTAGFCFGVANAVTKAEKEAEKNNKIYCLGDLVHNNEVKKDLIKKGVIFIDRIEDADKKLIIRSHGAEKKIYKDAKMANIELIDLTCPKVLKTHILAEEYKEKGYYIFLIGEPNHSEAVSTISYCGDESNMIGSIDDVENAIQSLYESNKKEVVVICQTTISMEKFNTIIAEIKDKLNKNVNIKVINTICPATRLREEEAAEISKQVEMMITIGGKHSSNTKKLYEISSKYCKNAIWIETKAEVDLEHMKGFDKIGIMAGASTPQKSIQEVVEVLKNI